MSLLSEDLPVTWIAIRSTGVTAWVMLTLVVLLGLLLRTRLLDQAAPPQRLIVLHRYFGALALTFVAIHMLLLLVDPAVTFTIPEIFIPMLAPWKPWEVALGIAAFWSLLPVLLVAATRGRLGKQGNRLFKKTHIAAYCAWPLATLHYIVVGTDALVWWSMALIFTGSGLLIFMLLTRGYVPKPSRKKRQQSPMVP